MKRKDLLVHLFQEGCVQVREGARHTVFLNPKTRSLSTVPRHNDVDTYLARKICRDLGIRQPKKR